MVCFWSQGNKRWRLTAVVPIQQICSTPFQKLDTIFVFIVYTKNSYRKYDYNLLMSSDTLIFFLLKRNEQILSPYIMIIDSVCWRFQNNRYSKTKAVFLSWLLFCTIRWYKKNLHEWYCICLALFVSAIAYHIKETYSLTYLIFHLKNLPRNTKYFIITELSFNRISLKWYSTVHQ